MAETRKILGQLNPSATTLTAAYTVPGGTQAVISTITITNTGSSTASFRVSVAVAGAADNAKQYIYYDVTMNGNDTFASTLGICLAPTDVVRVYASNGNLAFNIFGVELT
jgi:hypothetical protein